MWRTELLFVMSGYIAANLDKLACRSDLAIARARAVGPVLPALAGNGLRLQDLTFFPTSWD